MKKILMSILFAGLFVTAVLADSKNVSVQLHELPDAARELVKKYFGDVSVASATKELEMPTSYEVTLVDGTILDFDSRGAWTEINRPRGVIPAELIPQPIAQFVAKNYPARQILSIEREGHSHIIELDNGLELTFNRKHQLVEADH